MQIQARAYGGEDDLAVILALIRARPTARVLDFPSLYDLHELMGTESKRNNTQLWLGADGRLLGFAIVDLTFNTLWVEVATSVPEASLLAEMIPWATERVLQPHEALNNAGLLQISCRDHYNQQRIGGVCFVTIQRNALGNRAWTILSNLVV